MEKGILDHMETKRWAMRFTLDAVLTVLKAGHGRAPWITLVVEDSVDMAGYGGNGHHTNICLIDWYGWFELVDFLPYFKR